MADESTGRSRGRARGRARGQVQDTTRRPGQEAGPAPIPTAVHPGDNGGGRRTHRGVPRVDPAPPAQAMHQISEGMQQMHLESGRGRSREGPARMAGDINTRPAPDYDKRGKTGTLKTIVANYFEVLQRPQWAVHQYHVDFAPNVESSRMRRIFMREHKETLGSCYLFDGMSDLKSLTLLKDGTELFSTRQTDQETIRITLKYVTELAPSHPELGRLFNTQMRRNLSHLKYQLLGRHFFDQSGISNIPKYNLQIWQGVITSIRQMEERLMMSVDTVHKVVRQETALQIISNLARRGGEYREEVLRELVGCIVMTRYNNRTYSVEDVDWNINPESTFESRDKVISYLDYYKNQYEIIINDRRQPLLLCKSKEREIRDGASTKRKIYIVPELAVMTGITDAMRADFGMLKEMAIHTRLDPNQRVTNLKKFITSVNSNENVRQEMSAWGLKFADNLVSFQGRVLPEEQIVLGERKVNYKPDSGDFSREIRGAPMQMSVHLSNWVLIVVGGRDESCARDYLTNLYKVCPPMGMRVNPPNMVVIQQDRINNFLQAFRDNVDRNTQLVCFVVSNNKKERYDALKKHTCLDSPVPSQVIVSRTLSKKPMLMSIATKIGIQMNCKLGGEPWSVVVPFTKKIMVIGFDTYHDSAKRGRSAGAFVASLNQSLSRWYSNVTFHSVGGWEEISNHVNVNVSQALKRYHALNGCHPDMIFYYRDGVGDGQVRYVLDWEVKPLANVIQQNLAAKSVNFAFIIVNKKVNSRFFMPTSSNNFTNPPPGTLIDNTVTRYDRYDFFLISQSVRQGTVGPTMYNVIYDKTGLPPEYMQRLTYKLTHLYYNWQGTIRVPAPCQYAHKLAFLAGQSLHQAPRQELSEKLYYL